MKFSRSWLCVFAVVAACSVSSPDDRSSGEETSIDESALSSADPAVDPDALSLFGQAALAACHGTVTCDPSIFVCPTSWSAPISCGVKSCSVTCLNGAAIASLQPREVTHTCLGPNNSTCTEWSPTLAKKTCKDPDCDFDF